MEPSGATPSRTDPPLPFRNAHNVSPARGSCPEDFLNSRVSDSPCFTSAVISLRVMCEPGRAGYTALDFPLSMTAKPSHVFATCALRMFCRACTHDA